MQLFGHALQPRARARPWSKLKREKERENYKFKFRGERKKGPERRERKKERGFIVLAAQPIDAGARWTQSGYFVCFTWLVRRVASQRPGLDRPTGGFESGLARKWMARARTP